MRYFELLNLRREPFSNSPDPDLFYNAPQHKECLQALEIALRLKRGLCVVTGHVGTGKTTLCRQLIRMLGSRQGVVTHLVLDPSYSDAREFLIHLAGFFGLEEARAVQASDLQLREHLKSALWTLAVEQDRLVALIVDEGQKISLECLEILRELLNFETNEHKLLQIVIFAQLEFEPILESKANLADRVNMRFRLGPLDFRSTRDLIQARLAMCAKDISPEGLFTFGAFVAVYLATDGFPRQILQLCHQALLAVIIKEKPRVTWGVVRSCMRWRTLGLPRRRRWPRLLGAGVLLLAAVAGWAYFGGAPLEVRRLGSMLPELSMPKLSLPELSMPDVGSWFRKGEGGARVAGGDEAPSQGKTPAGQAPTAAPAASPAAGEAAQAQTQAQTQAGPQPAAPAQERQSAPVVVTAIEPGASGGPAPSEASDPAAQRPSGPMQFNGVRATLLEGVDRIEIVGDRPVERFEISFKARPARFVLDIPGLWERRTDREVQVGSARVDKVRSAVHPDKLRIAIYLQDASAGAFAPQVEKTPTGLRIVLK
ncbi:AAA family ATPase [Fundidesulfovibrio agrisoli]|uniref:AAA family ATPase n=1 Tax=Fundidesulfovibrio agrisoli TaxID=2922717 RepID=UPI001FAD7D60|nr:AAA family ATPase [Fundidesulfovibrio agrisoli]